MKKIIFGGAYGLNSYGDDAALLSLYYGIKARIGEIDCQVLSRHASNDCYGRYGIKSIQNIEYQSKAESQGKWFYGFNYNDDRTQLKAIYNEIVTSDLLVLGAGNFLVDYAIDLFRGPIPYIYILTVMAKMGNTPVMWYGVSAGPVKSKYGRDLSYVAAGMVDTITVRDAESRSFLNSIGYKGEAILLPDSVIALPLPIGSHSVNIQEWIQVNKMANMVIAVSVRSLGMFPNQVYEKYLKTIANACDYFIRSMNASVIFIPQCCYTHGNPDEDDRVVAKMVIDRMENQNQVVLVERELTVEECLGIYSGSIFSLCTRLHGNVFSAMNGVPSIAINYNPKVKNFMSWLEKPQLTVNLDELDVSLLVEKANYIIKNRAKLGEEILERIQKGHKQAQQYADIACDLLEGRKFAIS
ncbi:MAG: polysaccharide pyruvyl transferase family protein [Syntrophomonas sp.]